MSATWPSPNSTIEQFLDEYIDCAANEDRDDEDLLLESREYYGEDWTGEPSETVSEEAYHVEPAHTLSHIIDRGLDTPRRRH